LPSFAERQAGISQCRESLTDQLPVSAFGSYDRPASA
jgi:hypothetical protein